MFLDAKTVGEREKIYREYLQEPINTMIESIIRTYKLYRQSYEFNDLHADTLSFLMTKFDKFKPEKGKRSFSYFGTICKNYLFGEMVKEYKKNMSLVDIDQSEGDILKRDELLYRIDNDELDLNIFIESLASNIRKDLDADNLSENEFKVGHSLVKILEEWRELFSQVNDGKNSPKFNKNLILLYIRNMTGLNTKEIRNSMKRFKSLYKIFKDDYLDAWYLLINNIIMVPKKKKVDVSEESMKELMQETYNEIVDERNRALTAYKKFSKDINENSDIALVGKITNDLLKIIDSSIEKKLRLIKIQGDILYKSGKPTEGSGVSMTITDEDRKWAEEFIKKQGASSDTNEKEYE